MSLRKAPFHDTLQSEHGNLLEFPRVAHCFAASDLGQRSLACEALVAELVKGAMLQFPSNGPLSVVCTLGQQLEVPCRVSRGEPVKAITRRLDGLASR